jgi:hypothetical protein
MARRFSAGKPQAGRWRRAATACAKFSSTGTVSAKERQASVMLCPGVNGRPASCFCAPPTRWLSEHHADDRPLATGDLRGEVGGDLRLVVVLLAAVAMAAVDEHDRQRRGFLQEADSLGDVLGIVIRARAAAPAQHEMTFGVAGGGEHGRRAFAGQRGKAVRMPRGHDGIHRHLQVAVGAVLEADRHREPGGEFAVDLALGRAGADGGPGDEVGVILAERGVEELGADGQAGDVDVEQ